METLPEDFGVSLISSVAIKGNLKLWLYGFVKALMELLLQCPEELDLPADLSRIEIRSRSAAHTAHSSIRLVPTDVEDAKVSVKDYENKLKRRVVFFLDEFTAIDGRSDHQERLAFLRRKLMDLSCCGIHRFGSSQHDEASRGYHESFPSSERTMGECVHSASRFCSR